MSAAREILPVVPAAAPHIDHTWELRGIEYEDAAAVQRFECSFCGDVRFA